jgi:Leucine-rich repeat (LRR) protein
VVTKLRSLDISHNRIDILPDSIGLFTSLRTLSGNNNKIGEEVQCQHTSCLATR